MRSLVSTQSRWTDRTRCISLLLAHANNEYQCTIISSTTVSARIDRGTSFVWTQTDCVSGILCGTAFQSMLFPARCPRGSFFHKKIVEVDPVKFRADLESYEDLKRRLVLDTASFGAVSALAAWQVRNREIALLPRRALSKTFAVSQEC